MYQQLIGMQASHEAWEAAGEQLLNEEQQASAKAAAKKAKKLRQKTNRQQAQQAAATAASCSLHANITAHPAAPPSSIHPESSHDAGVPVSPPSGLQHQQSVMPWTKPAADAEQLPHQACSEAGRAVEASACCGGAAHQVSEAAEHAGLYSLPNSPTQGCADEDNFLQDLFKCPITQVSQSILTCMYECAISMLWHFNTAACCLLPTQTAAAGLQCIGYGHVMQSMPFTSIPQAKSTEILPCDVAMHCCQYANMPQQAYFYMQVTMTDCVIAADGMSYERDAITGWLQHSSVSPVTGQPLQHKRLLPNVLLRTAISMHCGGHTGA